MFLVVIIRSITKPLTQITNAAVVMSSGDLRPKLNENREFCEFALILPARSQNYGP